MKKVLDNEHVTLYVHPEKGIVHHVLHKWISGDVFKEMFLTGAEVFEKHKCTKWLSNDANNSVLKEEDAEWAQTVWEPRILKGGWKYWALILPQKIIGQMNMKRFVERYEKLGVAVKTFSDEESAMEWLENPS